MTTQRNKVDMSVKQEAKDREALVFLAIDSIIPNRHQPRKEFDQKALDELAASIESVGLLQPIVVKPIHDPENFPQAVHYELVAGERRWRAHQALNREVIESIIRYDMVDEQSQLSALIENLQRQDLNPIEEAVAYKKLMELQKLTQQQVAQRVGKSRPYIAQLVRLVKLDDRSKELVAMGLLDRYHAYMLSGVEDAELQVKLAEKAAAKQWSTALLAQQIKKATEPVSDIDDNPPVDVLENTEPYYLLLHGVGEEAKLLLDQIKQELKNEPKLKLYSGMTIKKVLGITSLPDDTSVENEQASLFEA